MFYRVCLTFECPGIFRGLREIIEATSPEEASEKALKTYEKLKTLGILRVSNVVALSSNLIDKL